MLADASSECLYCTAHVDDVNGRRGLLRRGKEQREESVDEEVRPIYIEFQRVPPGGGGVGVDQGHAPMATFTMNGLCSSHHFAVSVMISMSGEPFVDSGRRRVRIAKRHG